MLFVHTTGLRFFVFLYTHNLIPSANTIMRSTSSMCLSVPVCFTYAPPDLRFSRSASVAA